MEIDLLDLFACYQNRDGGIAGQEKLILAPAVERGMRRHRPSCLL
jgi:hypothetical protein